MRVEEPDVAEKDDDLEEETETVEISTDNVGDPSVEINVEELISELEAEGIGGEPPESEQAAKRRFEDLMERKRHEQELEDFDDYDV